MPILQPEHLLRAPDVSPLALLALLTAKYKDAWITDDIEHVLLTLEEDYGNLHPLAHEKLRALRACAHTKAPWTRFEVFAPVMQALSGVPPAFNRHVILDPHQLALGINVLSTLRTEHFDDEVRKYMAASLMEKGLHIIPIFELSPAQDFLRPFNQSAQIVFDNIKEIPLPNVDVDISTNDGVQAVKGRAELAVYRDTLQEWRTHIESARRLV